MKTESNTKEGYITERMREIFVPKNVVGSVLTQLEEYSIQTDYLGLDQETGRITLQVKTFDWQEPHLRKIISDMESDSAMITLVFNLLVEIALAARKQYRENGKTAA